MFFTVQNFLLSSVGDEGPREALGLTLVAGEQRWVRSKQSGRTCT